jgi:hypothetical protein
VGERGRGYPVPLSMTMAGRAVASMTGRSGESRPAHVSSVAAAGLAGRRGIGVRRDRGLRAGSRDSGRRAGGARRVAIRRRPGESVDLVDEGSGKEEPATQNPGEVGGLCCTVVSDMSGVCVRPALVGWVGDLWLCPSVRTVSVEWGKQRARNPLVLFGWGFSACNQFTSLMDPAASCLRCFLFDCVGQTVMDHSVYRYYYYGTVQCPCHSQIYLTQ